MMMEHITQMSLLKAYIKQNYANKVITVILLDDVEFPSELEDIEQQLDEMALLPPKQYTLPGILLIEMERTQAHCFVNNNAKSGVRMYIFDEGILTHENY